MPYVVDFAAPEANLIVELDGGQHFAEEARMNDERRTAYLESEGFRVVRFANNAITEDIDAVLESIIIALR